MRALAAVGVFVYHVVWRSPPIRDLALPLWAHLDVGVDVFFVLSGFLVYRPFVAAHVGGFEPPRPVAYFARRFARVYPAYWVALLTVVLVGETALSGPSGVLKHLTLTFTWFGDRGGEALRIAWTLVIEVTFYLLVPLWAMGIRRLSRRHRVRSEIVGVLALLALGAGALWAVTNGGVRDPAPFLLLPALLGLGAGMLLAVSAAAPGAPVTRHLHHLAARPAACFAAAGALYLVVLVAVPVDATPPVVAEPAMRLVQGLLQAGIGFLVVLPVALRAERDRREVRSLRVLGARPLVGVGVVSYGLYLWHVPVLRFFAGGLQDHGLAGALFAACVAFALSLGLAAVSYRFVEQPANRLAIRWVRRRRGASAQRPSGSVTETEAAASG